MIRIDFKINDQAGQANRWSSPEIRPAGHGVPDEFIVGGIGGCVTIPVVSRERSEIALPDRANRVLLNERIGGEDCHGMFDGLANQDAIKRILVVVRQFGQQFPAAKVRRILWGP